MNIENKLRNDVKDFLSEGTNCGHTGNMIAGALADYIFENYRYTARNKNVNGMPEVCEAIVPTVLRYGVKDLDKQADCIASFLTLVFEFH